MESLRRLTLNGNGFVFDPMSGESFRVDEIGLYILKGLQQNRSEIEIAAGISDQYFVNSNDALYDIKEFVGSLRMNGLLYE